MRGYGIQNNLIVVCGGGVAPLNNVTSACYSMSNDLKWTHFANLTREIAETASVIVNNGLWVTGKGDKFFLKLIM